MKPRCICGCGRRAVQRHHVVYQQELRARWRAGDVSGPWLYAKHLTALFADERNLIWICKPCHERHHQRVEVLPLELLPDSVFEFAVELMGAGAAYEYLRRYYAGSDRRLAELIAA